MICARQINQLVRELCLINNLNRVSPPLDR
jgi:hypothetical protein